MSTHFFYSVVVYDNGKCQMNKNHIFKTVENIANIININLNHKHYDGEYNRPCLKLDSHYAYSFLLLMPIFRAFYSYSLL